MAELRDREAGPSHDRSQKGRALPEGLFCDAKGRRAAPAHHLGVGPQSAQHRVEVQAKREVPAHIQAASTSFTRRTALEASSA